MICELCEKQTGAIYAVFVDPRVLRICAECKEKLEQWSNPQTEEK